jgi:predicted hydrolase (HD superfamily)
MSKQQVYEKMKDKAFVRGVNREDVIQGACELDVSLHEHISICLAVIKKCANDL